MTRGGFPARALEAKKLAISVTLGAVIVASVLVVWHLVSSRDLRGEAESAPIAYSDPGEHVSPDASETAATPVPSPTADEPRAATPDKGSDVLEEDAPPESDESDDAVWQALANELAQNDPRILMAKAMLGAGEYDDALAMLQQIISDDPGTDVLALAHLMKGIALWGKGDMEAALAEYQAILLEYPQSAAAIEAVDRFGLCHLKLRSVLDGMEWIANVLEADPANTAAGKAKWELVKRASRCAPVSDLEELWEICMEALAGGKGASEGYEAGLALARALRGVNTSKMCNLLGEISQSCPDPTIAGKAKVELAELSSMWGNFGEVVRLTEEVIQSMADEAVKKRARLYLARAYVGEGNIQMASEVFDQVMLDGWTAVELCSSLEFAAALAIERRLVNEPLLQWLGDLTATEGPVGEYVAVLRSLVVDPLEQDALQAAPFDTVRWLGRAYARVREYDSVEWMGVECLRKAEEDYPGNLEKLLQAVDLIASAMAGRGNYSDAADMLATGLERFPDDPDTAVWAMQRIRYLKADGRYEEAIAEYERIARDFPDSTETAGALYCLGSVYQTELNDLPKARDAYQRLIDRYPDSSYAEYARERLENLGVAQ